MDNEHTPTEEELATEQAALTLPTEEELKEKIVEEYGFDPAVDSDKIDRMAKERLTSAEKLSKAIGQKIKHREDADKLRKTIPPAAKPPVDEKNVDELVQKRLDTRDIEQMDLTPALEKRLRRIMQIDGVSAIVAAKDPTFVAGVAEQKKTDENEAATISRKNNGGGKKAYNWDKPPNPDMSTEEGRKEWKEYKAEMVKQGH